MDYLQYSERTVIETQNPDGRFKPYYKWITFNTTNRPENSLSGSVVLNLIINGLPSILCERVLWQILNHFEF